MATRSRRSRPTERAVSAVNDACSRGARARRVASPYDDPEPDDWEDDDDEDPDAEEDDDEDDEEEEPEWYVTGSPRLTCLGVSTYTAFCT